MQFSRRSAGVSRRLGVFPGGFNPPTRAHLDLAQAALKFVDEVLFVVPKTFPHKEYRYATLENRIELLERVVLRHPNFSIGISDRGLFIEIARECREAYGPDVRLSFICGRDAAERVAGWDYGRSGAWQEMLREFDLLVAPRAGSYRPEPDQMGSFDQIDIDPVCEEISATEVRRRIAASERWEDLVPDEIRGRVREIYT